MSRTFKDSLEDDLAVFINPDEFAVEVTITRGEYTPTTNVPALPRTENNAYARTPDRMSLKVEQRHYQIRTADYIVNGVESLPTEGDKITETLQSGVVVTGEVKRTSDRPCFELDSSGLVLLVHTKRI